MRATYAFLVNSKQESKARSKNHQPEDLQTYSISQISQPSGPQRAGRQRNGGQVSEDSCDIQTLTQMSQSIQDYKSIGRKMLDFQQFNNSFIKLENPNLTPHNPPIKKIEIDGKEEEFTTNRDFDLQRDEMMAQLDGDGLDQVTEIDP